MFNNIFHPNVTLSDWETFVKSYSPFVIDRVIDRHEAHLPEWFVPLARGAAIPSEELLRQVGHRHGKHRPHGWRETDTDYFLYPLTLNSSLLVREIDDTNLWTIERLQAGRRYEVDDVLVFVFGWTPILARSYQSAMRLAMHCRMNWRPGGLIWIKGIPTDLQPAIEIARQRDVREASCASGAGSQRHLH